MAGGTCCIASSAEGSSLAHDVSFLRNYRDNTVKRSVAGSRAVSAAERFYYSFSHFIAKLNAKSSISRALTRFFYANPIVSLLLFGMLFFESGRQKYAHLEKSYPSVIQGVIVRTVGAVMYACGWIVWNFSLFLFVTGQPSFSLPMTYSILSMILGLFVLKIGDQLHSKVFFA